ncbi:MAG: hypothetical protein ACD_11C00013G0003 [uncultured bacterium]|nr:MAG: hypothetical protein ACD_11C00013G0003 [uncultured bacterium]
MQNLLKNLKWFSFSAILGIVIGGGLIAARAWTEPTVAPPGGNIGAPINTSVVGQSKSGNLMVNTFSTINNVPTATAITVPIGNVGIGAVVPSPGLKLDVEGKVGATEYCDENGEDCTDATESGFLATIGGSREDYGVRNIDHKVRFFNERYDENDEYDANTYTFTAKTAGKYNVSAHVGVCDLQTTPVKNYASLSIYKNGNRAFFDQGFADDVEGGTPCAYLGLSPVMKLNAGDTLDIRILHKETDLCMSSGLPGIPNCYASLSSGADANWFSVTKVK